ncbi:MAG: hypothetical protein U9R08_05420 [Nanoarchaeota archaeon]|nr:hypothetical protein [Nanoarchaeota archaeon]
MRLDQKDEFLIVVSVITAVLVSKVADFLLPLSSKYNLLNITEVDPWLGLLVNIIILVVVAFLILKIVKWIAKKAIE